MKRNAVCFALLIGCLVAGRVLAEGLIFTGQTTAGSPLFTRPSQGTPPGASSAVVRYHAQGFDLPSPANCSIEGAQDYDGYLHLYQGSFNPASPLTNVLAGDDDDPAISTRGSQITNIALAAGHYVVVNSAFSSGFGNFQTVVRCTVQPITAPCRGLVFTGIPASQTTCLLDRFLVAIDSVSSSPTGGFATPVRMGTSDTGLFWFYNSVNIEAMIKVIDGCGLNNRYWVFAAASTDQQYQIIVGDTVSFQVKTYFNPLGNAADAVTDTSAFATCP